MRSSRLTELAGVGPALAAKLERLNVHRVDDLLFLLPLRYEDRTRLVRIGALAAVLVDGGLDGDTARRRAERAVIMLQGSLVLSRGMGTTRPFGELLQSLPDDLLAAPATARPRGSPKRARRRRVTID